MYFQVRPASYLWLVLLLEVRQRACVTSWEWLVPFLYFQVTWSGRISPGSRFGTVLARGVCASSKARNCTGTIPYGPEWEVHAHSLVCYTERCGYLCWWLDLNFHTFCQCFFHGIFPFTVVGDHTLYVECCVLWQFIARKSTFWIARRVFRNLSHWHFKELQNIFGVLRGDFWGFWCSNDCWQRLSDAYFPLSFQSFSSFYPLRGVGQG